MILGLVFSKDRALQLEGCLSSFFRHVTDADLVDLTVVYSLSSPRFERQYEEVARSYDGKVRFVREGLFREDVFGSIQRVAAPGGEADRASSLQWIWSRISGRPPVHESQACVLFLVDDTLFVREFSMLAGQAALEANPDALGFSLRLGRNITETYVLKRGQSLPGFQTVAPGVLKYRWIDADGDFGYPLELSSSLYPLPLILRLLVRTAFTNPNTLESQISVRARRYARSHPFMLCPDRSVAFSTPINRVQAVFENRVGSNPRWSTDNLAELFDRGQRIDVSALDDFVPAACHQEVDLPLIGGPEPNAPS